MTIFVDTDYDALLTEAGDITEKYRIARQLIYEATKGREEPFLPKLKQSPNLIHYQHPYSLVCMQ